MADYLGVDFDDIVVGAGSSGAPLTARLSEDRARKVAVIEAGPDYQCLVKAEAVLNRQVS